MTKLTGAKFECDLSFRPKTYWEHDNPISAIVSNVTGTARRQIITGILTAEGEERELNSMFPGISADPDFFDDETSEDLRSTLSSIHPHFMGGEYLPKYLRGEVEIARVQLQSSTADVISVRARRKSRSSVIRYRIVDEYPEYGPYRCRVRSSTLPLTMKRIVKLIDTARGAFTEHIDDCESMTNGLRNNLVDGGADHESASGFVSVFSHFYPELSRYYDNEAELWIAEQRLELEDEDDDNGEEADEDWGYSRP